MDLARRNQTRLIAAQLLCGIGIASGVAVGGLLGEKVSGTTVAAGFAQTSSVVGAAIVAIPLARLAARRGRRFSLSLGFSLATFGALVILAAVATMQFWLLLLGMMFFGAGQATSLQSRFAATELVDAKNQARAMSTVLWATTLGSVAGPNLSEPGSRLGLAWGLNPLAGPYLFSIVAFGLAALVASTLRMGLPPGSASRTGGNSARPVGTLTALGRASRIPHALFAIVTIVGGQMMMTTVMVMTPVSMNHEGMSLELVGLVISIHVLGMYAASPVFGWLADRIGSQAVIAIGVGLFVVAFALGSIDATAHHSDMARITTALAFLGLGWSATIIGGSALLTRSVPVDIKVPLQGAVDAIMNFGAAGMAALAGPMLALAGFLGVNIMALGILVPIVVFGIRARLRARDIPSDSVSVAPGK